ncbi:hypothetical protein B0H13DRAFT_1878159 [Mycena leptocephala]|nr:hypothetical protein B0H13DRAFT_1878159 [Mycena leptocephala]
MNGLSASSKLVQMHKDITYWDPEQRLEPGEGGDALELELESGRDGDSEGSAVAGEARTRARHAGQRPSEAGRLRGEWRTGDTATSTHGGDVFGAKDVTAGRAARCVSGVVQGAEEEGLGGAMATHQMPQSAPCSCVELDFERSGAWRGAGVGDTDTEAESLSAPKSKEYCKLNWSLARGASRRKGSDASAQRNFSSARHSASEKGANFSEGAGCKREIGAGVRTGG